MRGAGKREDKRVSTVFFSVLTTTPIYMLSSEDTTSDKACLKESVVEPGNQTWE